MKKYTCPCCGYMTLDEQPTGTYEIRKICFWEDQGVQFDDPDYEGRANEVSLRQGRKNFIRFGACEDGCVKFVRQPTDDDVGDPNWHPLSDIRKINLEID